MPQTSTVQQLREQIETELTSMRLGVHGLAAGVAKHRFIESKMQRIGHCEDQLAQYVGREQACTLTCQAYMQRMGDR